MIKLLLKMNCSNILVQGITIIAPVTSPNTDGINPGLCLFNSISHVKLLRNGLKLLIYLHVSSH